MLQRTAQHRTLRTTQGTMAKAIGLILVGIVVIALLFVWAAPIFWMIITSFKPDQDIMVYPPEWFPKTYTAEHYTRVLGMYGFAHWFQNSLVVAIITTLLTLILQSMAAYPLSRMQFPGRAIILLVILSTFMVPSEIAFVPLFLALSSVEMTNTYQALILPVAASPFGLFLFTQFYKNIPTELEDAARIDGCGSWRIYWNIILPLSQPAAVAVTIFTFMGSWNNFMWPLIVTQSTETFTLPVGLANIATRSITLAFYYGDALAASTIVTVPALIVFLLLQRHFVKGITMTGLKG